MAVKVDLHQLIDELGEAEADELLEYGPHTKPLAGPGSRRAARVGALRIVFIVDRDRHIVDVSDIGPRG